MATSQPVRSSRAALRKASHAMVSASATARHTHVADSCLTECKISVGRRGSIPSGYLCPIPPDTRMGHTGRCCVDQASHVTAVQEPVVQPSPLPLIAERPEVRTPVAARLAVGPRHGSAGAQCTDG